MPRPNVPSVANPLARNPIATRFRRWLSARIKLRVASICAVVLVGSLGAADEFVRGLPADEFAAAGLAKLTPAELAKLNALVAQYREIPPQPTTKEPAATKPGPSPRLPAWVSAVITLQKVESHPEQDHALESRLVGSFSGWTGRSTFRLENGQLWAQANRESYDYYPTLKSPKITIRPSSFGSYWMEIEGVHQRCRVKPIKLE